jgi:hypothetical protein
VQSPGQARDFALRTEDADDFVRHAIARTIIALTKAGEREL